MERKIITEYRKRVKKGMTKKQLSIIMSQIIDESKPRIGGMGHISELLKKYL